MEEPGALSECPAESAIWIWPLTTEMATGVLKGMVVSLVQARAASWSCDDEGVRAGPAGVRANSARCGETAGLGAVAGVVTEDAVWAARTCCGSFTRMSTTAPLCRTICAVAEAPIVTFTLGGVGVQVHGSR